MRNYLIIIAVCVLLALAWGKWQYHEAWDAGRQDLVAQQKAKAEKAEAKQHKDDEKAVAADEEGKAKTIVITNEVVKYVKTPGHTVCVFDDRRVQLKRAAVANANAISGYDEDAVQIAGPERRQ